MEWKLSVGLKMGMCNCENMDIVYDAGDGIDSCGRYRWHATYSCRQCGMSIEVDGGGVTGSVILDGLPDEVKTFIIHRDGKWQLVVDASKEMKSFLMHRILPNVEIDYESATVLSGTFAQMQWVKNQMIEK